MRRLARLLVTLLMLAFLAVPSLALTPDEVLPDAALEARARTISAELRCMICQNQSIDDSDAELAKDLRVLVRQRLVAGDSNDEVIAYVVSRYGEFVLLKPRMSWRNAALWATPAVLLIAGGLYILAASRRRRKDNAVPLTEAEKAALSEALSNDR
ncbi:MAG: cytochrome c-type biogenesis protein [Mesorhizobium sp.]